MKFAPLTIRRHMVTHQPPNPITSNCDPLPAGTPSRSNFEPESSLPKGSEERVRTPIPVPGRVAPILLAKDVFQCRSGGLNGSVRISRAVEMCSGA